ncbi:hypothetical protein SMALA_1526 [Streptomyces malaysiensis subsp. malaysiensis]|nr:hypothetical protein SMALA_1526 [Streptomyces malaysiensis]
MVSMPEILKGGAPSPGIPDLCGALE